MNTCSNCGHENEKDALFCESCGKKLSLEKSSKECRICHHLNDEDALFCESCGSSLDEDIVEQGKHCPYCNQLNDSNAQFCENCGQPMTINPEIARQGIYDEPISNVIPETVVETQEVVAPKQPMSKKAKITMTLLGILVIVFGGTYAFLERKYSKENQVEAIIVAIKDQDDKFIAKNMVSDDPSLVITSSDVKPMLKLFDDNKENVTNLKAALEANSEYLGLSLKKTGKTALFFPHYELNVTPVYTNVVSNMADSTIKMNGKKIIETDSDNYSKKIGPLIIGKYTFDASIKGKDETIKESYTLLPGDTTQVDMGFVTVTIPIRSNVDDATVLMDDKEVGKLTDGKLEVGPILWNGHATFQLVKKSKDGELKSEVKELANEDVNRDGGIINTIELNFQTADKYEVSEGLKSFYNRFEQSVISSNNYNADDFAKAFYIDGSKNSAFKGINDYISWCRDRSASGEYSGVDFSIVVKSVEPMTNNQYKVNYNVTYHTTYPSKTNKSKRVEGFDYSNVVVQLEMNDKKDITDFKFVDMGDGGQKVSDNHANE
ncbi:zinc ribbon domain-containing protein [Vagococcus luciliae]|uniref:RING-type domain-containing protein n=1 Tax=Vagococcus luciliae TaxID=2920380 RepID=A0ABY5NZ31_9ENTE|nr:zinc ribbon domain-containing protein [Vagococcus luciliae]UUV98909.1 hypothetical protein G314FT_10670 [Vagococcus luciliae]